MKVTVGNKIFTIEDYSISGSNVDDIMVEDVAAVDDEGTEVVNSALLEELCSAIQEQYADEVYTEWVEQRFGAAEAYYEGER